MYIGTLLFLLGRGRESERQARRSHAGHQLCLRALPLCFYVGAHIPILYEVGVYVGIYMYTWAYMHTRFEVRSRAAMYTSLFFFFALRTSNSSSNKQYNVYYQRRTHIRHSNVYWELNRARGYHCIARETMQHTLVYVKNIICSSAHTYNTYYTYTPGARNRETEL